MVDYLVIGFGLGGANLALRLEEAGKSFMVFDEGKQNASKVAGGIINPMILKRFNLAWNANVQLPEALLQYKKFEVRIEKSIIRPLPVFRKFASVEEQNNWFLAADHPQKAAFLETPLVSKINEHIPGPFSFGKVLNTYQLQTKTLLESYANLLKTEGKLQTETFDYHALEVSKTGVNYQGLKAKNIIFCEGFGMRKNPFFNHLPLRGIKGEYLLVKAPNLKLCAAVKAGIFVIPLGDDIYKVGATYNHHDKSPQPTTQAREMLLNQFNAIVNTYFTVIDQIAGIRPSTPDRRPMVGRHPRFSNLYCCNGFGSRGVLLAPTLSKALFQFIENSETLTSEINSSRFKP